ncbi:MAG TPA: hypothetical protein VD794_11595 [Flavisolibacter sp.]|nr:hypothetical protein [Flavisolibacter sp.]
MSKPTNRAGKIKAIQSLLTGQASLIDMQSSGLYVFCHSSDLYKGAKGQELTEAGFKAFCQSKNPNNKVIVLRKATT